MYTLTEVVSRKDRKAFLMLPVRLYKDVKEWIRPLDQSIENVFDPQKNAAFRDGVCIRWILKNERKQVIGRVAAFIDYGSANHNEQPTGGLGFFECENDQLAANMLFDACKNWLMSKGMQAMDGPINFGERNSWWGLLVEVYDIEPTFEMYYHFPYYRQLFEAYGFQNYINQYTYHRYIDTGGLAQSSTARQNASSRIRRTLSSTSGRNTSTSTSKISRRSITKPGPASPATRP